MEKSKRKFTDRQILLAVFAFVLICAFFVGFYFYRYHYYEFYGFFDGLRVPERWILKHEKYDADELEKLPISELDASKSLMLVNMQYQLSSEEKPLLVSAGEGQEVALEAYGHMQALFSACHEATGEELSITSSFRTFEKQEAIYAVNEFAVPPGASEHQCGLAVDVRTDAHASLNFIKSEAGKWLSDNAYKYGFIIRYPYWAEDVTGVTYEPWHLRYVGTPHAELIYRTRIVLEEYASLYKDGGFYVFENYVISRQKSEDGTLLFPKNAKNVTVSADNTGAYFIWGEIK